MPQVALSSFSARLRLGEENWSSVVLTAVLLLRDHLPPPNPHNCAFLVMPGVLGQEIQSGGKKPNHTKRICSALPTAAIFQCICISQHHSLPLNVFTVQKWSDNICISVFFAFMATTTSTVVTFAQRGFTPGMSSQVHTQCVSPKCQGAQQESPIV